MKTLKIEFQNCYGIKKLEHNFTFGKRSFVIYAPNGVMKTSFAKTFQDFSKDQPTKDLVFPERENKREINADIELTKEEVFVIEPYNADYQSDKISTLLANKTLKEEYENIHKDIEKSQKELVKKLKELSGLNGRNDNIEEKIEKIFNKPFYNFLLENEEAILTSENNTYSIIPFNLIFNEKTLNFLNTKDFKVAIKEYIEKYEELIQNSKYLKNDFNLYHLESTTKQLVNNNFFKAGHTVNLFDGKIKSEYGSEEDLNTILKEEKDKVLQNEDLQKRFEEIDNKIKANSELREFHNFLLKNKDILYELKDLDTFSKKIWSSYLTSTKELIKDLLEKYKIGQEQIKKIIEKAKLEETKREDIIQVFNDRFSHLPFYLQIQNKEDVILNEKIPSIDFIFKDGKEEKTYKNKKDLLDILSTGEKRALYILNILFEIEARKEQGKTLFIIDDIADSFDYKNKYAIIEYLKYMSEIENFYMILLTHNFDFFRTIRSRIDINWNNCFIANKKENGEVILNPISGKHIINPFMGWKEELDDKKKLIAFMPFIRNIIEYTHGDDNENYSKLTALLHYKDNTENIMVSDLKSIFETNIDNLNFPEIEDKKIIDLIFEAADECLQADEGINLENKIVLSIAIRLKSEKFMKSAITDQTFLNDLNNKNNQTWHLLQKYQSEFDNEKEKIEILKKVHLITPENIHINSFMYEPILDMGDNELKQLYEKVKNLT